MHGEKVNHDEFMRRLLELCPIDNDKATYFAAVGQSYLEDIRELDTSARAASIASYEDGGLESVFKAILQFGNWDNDLLRAFEHFLAEHVRFDSDPEQGHGALSRHIALDDRVLPLWQGFKTILTTCVPGLSRDSAIATRKIYEPAGAFEAFSLRAERLDACASVHEAVGD